MEIKKLYFDMDGVLADFDRGVKELCKIEPLPQNGPRTPEQDDELWAHIREVPHFYDKLEPMEGAIELFNKAYERFGDRVEILTGIPKEKRGIKTAGEDKISWAKRLLAKDLTVNVVMREEKPNFCKGREYVLVDDHKGNIKAWNEIGGSGILFTDAASVWQQICEL